MKNYILAIDQGTTGTTSLLIDKDKLQIIDKVNMEFPQIYPSPGWVEHNLNQIWETVQKTVTQLLLNNNINKNSICALGITNQRETVCAFDIQGHPLANAIVWQDRRTNSFCQQLKSEGKENIIKQKTGLTVDPYFSASKMQWLLKNNSQVMANLKEENLLFGTIDTFLLYKLSGHKAYATEATNASRTLLMDLNENNWDEELLKIFEVPRSCLPPIKDSFSLFGHTQGLSFLPDGIPITGILGDQQSALLGQAGTKKGSIKCTYGTGAFMLLNTGEEKRVSHKGLLTTVAFQHQGKRVYALEGSTYIAGAAVQWLRDSLNIIKKSSEIEDLANQISSLNETEHLLFMPFFTGIGSPYWKPEAKGAILGLTRDSSRPQLARVCLEGMALSIDDLLQSFITDCGRQLDSINVDGGASANNLLLQIQANFSKLEVVRPKIVETTAFGSALAAAVGAELITLDDISHLWQKDRSFTPEKSMSQSEYYKNKKALWNEYIRKLYLGP